MWRLPVVSGRWDPFDVLDEQERHRRDRFLREADRARYQTAHVGARLLLGAYLGVPPETLRFSRDCRHCGADHGKPVVCEVAVPLDFSLTHSGDQVAIAVAAEPVGVDVQEIETGNDLTALSTVALSATELGWLRQQPPELVREGFFGYWTRKEALLKATGHGLAVAMTEITISPPTEPARLVSWTATKPLTEPVRLYDVPVVPGYAGSVAVLTADPVEVTVVDFPDP